jgi:predicted glutamine amidotransferase
MCLAIYKPADTAPDWNAYENGHYTNDDSWGFAVVVNGDIITRCGLGKFEEFREAFEPYADRQAIIHFRWATHGSTTEANCHPFMVAADLAMIHNGVIRIKCNLHNDRSDTWHFNELVLKPMHQRDPEFFMRSDVIFSQELAHASSKFCFLRADGTYEIWNAADGVWGKDGHWYSNDSYEEWYYRSACRSTTTAAATTIARKSEPSVMGEPAWIETEEGRWTYADDASVNASQDKSEDEDDECEGYSAIRAHDLVQFGFSAKCVAEVFEMLGHAGIEALHDAM